MSCCNQVVTGKESMAGSLREYISLQDQVKVGEYVDDHRLTVSQSGLAEMILTEVACVYLIGRVNTNGADAHLDPAILFLLMTGAGNTPIQRDEYAGAEGAGTALPHGDRRVKHINA